MQNQILTLPAQLNRFSRRVDRSVSLNFVSSLEIAPEQYIVIDTFFQREGWLLFAENPIQDSEIPDVPAEVDAKTPSQRLRAVLYIKWERSEKTMDFETFYRAEYERLINHYKAKLDT